MSGPAFRLAAKTDLLVTQACMVRPTPDTPTGGVVLSTQTER